MKRLQKILAVVLLLALVLSAVPAIPVAAEEIPTGGTCGDNLTWELVGTTLTISGTGDMPDYTTTTQPWKAHRGSITSVVISRGVTSVGKYAFYYCRKLAEVSFPSTLTKVNRYGFYKADAVADIHYTGTMEQWEQVDIASDNGSLADAMVHLQTNFGVCGDDLGWEVVGSTLTIFGTGKMYDYTTTTQPWKEYRGAITNVVLEEGVTSIGKYAFYYCRNLEQVRLPASLTAVARYAFYKAESVADVYYDGTEQQWAQVSIGTDNGSFSSAEKHFSANVELGSGTCGENLTWRLDSQGVLTISGEGAMTDFTKATQPWKALRASIVTVVLEEGVTSIGNYAFYYCNQMTSLTIPKTVTRINKNATLSAKKLAEVNYGSSAAILEMITSPTGNDKLLGAKLNTAEPTYKELQLTQPDKLVYLVGEELDLTGMVLTLVDGSGNTVTSNEYEVFGFNNQSLTTQTVTVVCQGLYQSFEVKVQNAGTCGDQGDNITWTLCDGVLELSGTGRMKDLGKTDSPFFGSYRANVRTVKVNEGITYLGKYAFYYCRVLNTVRLPLSLEKIGNACFYQCAVDVTDKVIVNLYYAGTAYQWSQTLGKGSNIAANNLPLVNASKYRYEKVQKIQSFEITTMPKLEYTAGEALDTTGMVIMGYYDDGEVKQLDNSLVKITGFVTNNPSTQTLTVSYGTSLSTEIQVKVTAGGTCGNGMTWKIEENVLTISGEGDMENYTGSTQPWKSFRNNFIKQIVIQEGVTSIGAYTGYYCKKLESVTIPASVTEIAADAFKSSAAVKDVYYAGSPSQWAAVTVAGGNTTFTGATVHCEAEDNAITGITVTAPAKTQYWKGEALDTTGMTVTAQYADGSSVAIAEGFAVTGFSNYRLGQQTITVTYEGFTATFTVTVSEPYITEMILTPPSKLTYVAGEDLELWGMNVMVRYSDGRTVGIGSGYNVSGYNSKKVGEQVITVSYQGVSATFTVTVTPPTLIGLELHCPDKLEYQLGEELDLSDMTVRAGYSDGSFKDVTDQVTVTGYDKTKPGKQTIVVTFQEEWVTFQVTVFPTSLELSRQTAAAGETVAVTITMRSNPGIVGARLKLSYDSSVLTLVQVEDGGILGENVHKPELTQPYTLCWANDVATENFTENGVLVTLYFTVAPGAVAGEYPITITYGTTNGDIMNKDLQDVSFQVVQGGITVTGQGHDVIG